MSSSRSALGAVLVSGAVLALGVVGTGYATAWWALDRCAGATLLQARQRGLVGYDMRGARVEPARGDLHAQISGPFRVEVWFSLPADLHATGYSQRFEVYPWAIQARPMRTTHYL